MNFTGRTSAEPMTFRNFRIRDYAAEVRKNDWRKCCPFKYLLGGSEEYNREAEMVYLSLFLEEEEEEEDDEEEEEDLVNTQGGIIPPNSDRNLVALQSQTFQMLSNVHQGLGGPSYDVTLRDEETEHSDARTLNTLIREIKRKGAESRIRKGKMKMPVSSNPFSEKSWGKTAVRSSKRQFRKTRTAPALAPSYLGDEENTSRMCENTGTASGAGQKKTWESSPTSDDSAAEVLLCLSRGQAPPAAGSGVPQDNQVEDEIPFCVINKNPSEFETEEAKKFMWRC